VKFWYISTKLYSVNFQKPIVFRSQVNWKQCADGRQESLIQYYIVAFCCTVLFNKFWGYVAVCVQLYCRWFAVLRLVVAVLHYMFRPTWPSSGVYDVLLLYSWRNLLRCFCFSFLHVVTLCTFSFVFLLCFFVSFVILVFVFAFLPFLVVCRFCAADTHTRIRKLTKEHNRKTNENVHSVTTCKNGQQKQRSRFLQEYKSETSYTPEDGHVGRCM
jgi:ABC-type multidrug transport system fused ATPase/permease subunit